MTRQPMGAYIALSGEYLDEIGAPKDITEDELAEIIDQALLADDTAMKIEMMQYIEDREREDAEFAAEARIS